MADLPTNVTYNTENTKLKNRYYYFIVKRFIDIVGALVGIILLLPIMLGTAIAIKFNSKGTTVFAQDRVGINGDIFRMYKFRSMISNA